MFLRDEVVSNRNNWYEVKSLDYIGHPFHILFYFANPADAIE